MIMHTIVIDIGYTFNGKINTRISLRSFGSMNSIVDIISGNGEFIATVTTGYGLISTIKELII